jgi:hypothetical protein
MPKPPLTTRIWLPPGIPPTPRVREFLQLVFAEFRWFLPVRFGMAFLDGRLDPERPEYDVLLEFYEEYKTLCVTARTDRDFFLIFPAKPDDHPYAGGITWVTSATAASKKSWRAAHIEQVARIMRLVRSPLATAALDDDIERKTRLLIHDGISHVQSFTVRDYSEGLPGLSWRNFYGPPFVRLFGERLDALPPEFRQSLGDEFVLVQPYPLPAQAGTDEGNARERELISLLGPECFYDHEHHTLPSRRPVLEPLP